MGHNRYFTEIKQIINKMADVKLSEISNNRKAWTPEEDQAIKRLVSIYSIEDWTQISNKLKEEYPSSKRSGKQCRERWYNHLSPTITKNPWTNEEEEKLFRLHQQQGNKWKDISKQFIGRTDNDLKNHFYSTLRKSLRRLNKGLGEKNSTSQMREIKPSVLSTIMNCIYTGETQSSLYECLKDVPSLIFEYANIKPMKSTLSLKDDQMKDKVLKIFTLINEFNGQYEKSKNRRKQKNTQKKEKLTCKSNKIKKSNTQIAQLCGQTQNSCEKSSSNNNFINDPEINNEIDNFLQSENNFQKNDPIHEHTEISSGYSSTDHSCLLDRESDEQNSFHSLPNQNQEEDDNLMEYQSDMTFFHHQNSRILDEDDGEIMQVEFEDPQEPSVFNQCCDFNEVIHGKNIFNKSSATAQQENYCHQIVDEVFANYI